MQYPLTEEIGHPDLLVGRSKEFNFFGKWIANMPNRLSKSHVILARRKSGKTAFIQRLFNQLWSANGQVIPFYFNVREQKMWYPDFAKEYYRTFATQYISFLERNAELVRQQLSLEEIREYGQAKSVPTFVHDIELMLADERKENYDLMWGTVFTAPERFAALYDRRVLVMIDEFQYLSIFIYRDKECQRAHDETIPGSFHHIVESKIAPMLVTGSYISWLLRIASKYLEGGRLSDWYMDSYLPPEEGLQAVYKYAEIYKEPITNETAALINELCMSDPFFISCVIQSKYEGRDLATEEGVIEAVNYEITHRRSEMSKAWGEYIHLALQKINDQNGKKLLLFLSKHNDRDWTPRELKQELHLEPSESDIQRKLELLVEADLLEQGRSDIQYHGLRDGTLYMILRNRFEMEIATFEPKSDLRPEFHEEIMKLKADKRRLQGLLNHLSGIMAEHQLALEFRHRKQFTLMDYFSGVQDSTPLHVVNVKERYPFQRADGKNWEIDVLAVCDDGREILVEVKKTRDKIGLTEVKEFAEKATAYQQSYPAKRLRLAYLSLGGFTTEATQFCEAQGIGLAEQIAYEVLI